LHVLYFESEKDFSQYAAPVFQPSGVPGESQLVLTDGWWMVVDGGWWMVDGGWAGSENRKKSCILKISRKLFDIFF